MKWRGHKWLMAFAGAVLVVLLFRSFVFTPYLIPESGMEDALYKGDRILVNKWSYGLRAPLMAWWGYHRWRETDVARENLIVFNNPAEVGQSVIERRKVFVGRIVGMPGDTLFVDSLYALAPFGSFYWSNQTALYMYPSKQEPVLDSLLRAFNIRSGRIIRQDSMWNTRRFCRFEYEMLCEQMDSAWIVPVDSMPHRTLYPLEVPGKNRKVRVYSWNMTLLCNTLVMHEGRAAVVRDGRLYVDGKAVDECTFTKDYYWVGMDNTGNRMDSRLFGFVPKDHIIGCPLVVWFSKDPDTSLWKGYRWERCFFVPH